MSGMRRLLMGPVASGYQSQPLFRFAAWSLRQSLLRHGNQVVPQCLQPFCQGCARQLTAQSPIYAVGYAWNWAAIFRAPIRIWTDCFGVITKFHLLVWGQKKLNVNRSIQC
jgi:hypothetical protein